MKFNWMRRAAAFALCGALLAVPALAAEEPAPQLPDAWAVAELADSYALGLVDDSCLLYTSRCV